jgi:hypothetical protein
MDQSGPVCLLAAAAAVKEEREAANSQDTQRLQPV